MDQQHLDSILRNIPDKRINKNTTSLKFKQDIIEFFYPLNLSRCVEIGTADGYSTQVLSYLFDEVVTIDISYENICNAAQFNKERTNIKYIVADSMQDWGNESLFDVSFIDANHTYGFVINDTLKSLQYGNPDMYIIFDDYGLPDNVPAVKVAVDELIRRNIIQFVKYIGEPAGSEPRIGRPLVDWEGIICKKIN